MAAKRHLYLVDEVDVIVARSPAEAIRLFKKHYSEEDLPIPEDLVAEQLDDAKEWSIYYSDAPENVDPWQRQTCEDWAAQSELGLLCSTEW